MRHDASIQLSVHRGQLLAQLDPSAFTNQLAITEAKPAQADLKDGRSAVAGAQAVVDEAKVNLGYTTIRSPIDGVVISRTVDVGQSFVTSREVQALFLIAADLKRMDALVAVDQSDIAGLTSGQPATFTVESYPHQTFHGTLRELRLEPLVAQANAVSYTAVVDVDNADELLRPGMTAAVSFDTATRADAVRIPNSALGFRPSNAVLSRLRETDPAAARALNSKEGSETRIVWEYDGKSLTPIQVKAGLTDDAWTELVSGPLHTGDELVTSAVLERWSRS